MTEEPQDRIPEALAAGIKGLALPKEPIPSRVDEAILAMAREELVPAEPDRSGWRLLRYGAVAAAVLIIGVFLSGVWQPGKESDRREGVASIQKLEDCRWVHPARIGCRQCVRLHQARQFRMRGIRRSQ